MLDIIKTMILDFHETTLETGTPRRLALTPVPRKASVCIGVRRCGKSTYMFQVMQRLLDKNVPRENILYLNFFDDRLHGLQKAGVGLVTEAYYSLFPEKKNAETVYCFFDEIQSVAGWEPFVDRLLRTEKCEMYLSGSSARMLSKEIATEMRGRALSWEMFPFSFAEFLDYKGIATREALPTKQRLLVQKAFDEYWETGGFPEVLAMSHQMRVKTHQEYFHAVLFRDLIERHDIPHPKAVADLAHWLLDNAAATYSVNRLTGYLKSLGHNAPKSAVSDYLAWMEDAYFFFSVRVLDASLARSQTNPKKCYCVDHAMVPSLSSGVMVNSGRLLENLVFVALRRMWPEVFYFKTKSGREVDFVIPARGRKPLLVQVCESMEDPVTRKREVQALEEAMRELGCGVGKIVTRHGNERFSCGAGTIVVLPAWRFLLDLPESEE